MKQAIVATLIAIAIIGLVWVLRFYAPVFHVELNEADGAIIIGYERR